LIDAEGKEVYYFAIITCKPNKKAVRVHPRMPVVLYDEDIKGWLDKDSSVKDLIHCLRPYENELTEVWKVPQLVNCNYKDGPELIKPL
jgi:putative SOS response-associated peptidase YedK